MSVPVSGGSSGGGRRDESPPPFDSLVGASNDFLYYLMLMCFLLHIVGSINKTVLLGDMSPLHLTLCPMKILLGLPLIVFLVQPLIILLGQPLMPVHCLHFYIVCCAMSICYLLLRYRLCNALSHRVVMNFMNLVLELK